MPNTVDTKVVEMKFKNDDFEEKVAKSQKTLDKLKKALNFEDTGKSAEDAFASVNEAVNSTDFSKLTAGIDSINNKLSAVGVATATAVNALTTEVGNKAKAFYDKTLGQIINGGSARAQKLASGKFKLKGVLTSAKEIKSVSDAIGASVTGTAYGLDAAYATGSQMVASGLRDTKKLQNTLTGVAGVAAMTGTSFEYIGGLFSEIQAAGAVSGDVLTRLTEQSLPVRNILAQEFGKSVDQINDMVKNKEISAEQFFEVMYKKYGAFAMKANETYSGALSNMNAALSRVGADFFTPYYENMRYCINATTSFINTFKSFITELGVYKAVEAWLIKARKAYVETMNTVTSAFVKTDSKTGQVFTKTAKTLISGINTIIKGVKHVLNMIAQVPDLGYNINTAFDKINIKDVVNAFKSLSEYLKKNHRIAISVRRGFGLLWTVFKTGLNAISGITVGLVKVGKSLGTVLLPIFETGTIIIGGFFRFLASTLVKLNLFVSKLDFSPFKSVLKDISKFGKSISDLPKTVYKNVGAFLKWYKSLNKAKDIKPVNDAINTINQAIATFANTLKTIGSSVGNFFTNVFGDAPKILQPVADTISNIINTVQNSAKDNPFGFLTGISEVLKNASNDFADFGNTVSQTINNNIAPIKDKVQPIFDNLQSTLDSIIIFIKGGMSDIKSLDWTSAFASMESFGSFIAGLASGAFGTAANAFLDILGQITKGINGFMSGISKVSSSISKINMDNAIPKNNGGFLANFSLVGTAYADTLEPIEQKTQTFGDTLTSVFENLKNFISSAAETISGFISSFIDNVDWTDVLITINTLSTAIMAWDFHKIGKALGNGLPEVFENIGNFFKEMVRIPESISGMFDTLKNTLTSFQKEIQPNKLLAIGASLAMIAGALLILSKVPQDDLNRSLAALAGSFAVMTGAILGMAKAAANKNFNFVAFNNIALVFLGMGASMLLIAKALSVMSDIDSDKLKESSVVLVAILGSMSLLASKLAKVDAASFTALSVLLISLGISMNIIAGAIQKLGEMPVDILTSGVAAFTAIIGILGAFIIAIGNMDKVFAAFTNNPFSKGIKPYGEQISTMQVNFMQIAGAILIISVAMNLIAKSLETFGMVQNLDTAMEGFVFTLLSVIAALGVLATVQSASKIDSSSFIAIAASIAIVAAAMNLMASAVLIFGAMDVDTLNQGLTSFIILLGSVSLALGLLGGVAGGGNVLAAATGILLLSVAMTALLPVITVLGAMSWDTLASNLAKFAVALGVVCALAAVIGVFSGAIMAAGTALAVFGASIVVLGAGLIAVGVGLLAISAAGLGAAAAIQAIVLAIGQALPTLATDIALAITALITTLGKMAPEIGEALKSIIISAVQAVVDSANEILDMVSPLIDKFLTFISEKAPELGQAFFDLLNAGIQCITDNIDTLIDNLIELIRTLLLSLVDHLDEFVSAISDFLDALFDKVGELVGDVDLGEVIKGFTDAFSKIFGAVADGIKGILDSVGGIFGQIANVIWAIKDLIVVLGDQGFGKAVENAASLVTIGGSIADFAGKVSDKADILQKTGEGVKNLADGLNTLQNVDTSVINSIKGLGSSFKKVSVDSKRLSTASDAVKQFAETISDGVAGKVMDVRTQFSEFSHSIESLAYNLWDLNNNATNVNNSLTNVSNTLNDLHGAKAIDSSTYATAFNDIASEADKAASDMYNKGASIGSNLESGLRSKLTPVYNAGQSLTNNARSGISSTNSGFYGLGSDAGQGYVNGIKSKESSAYWAGHNLGKQAEKGTKEAQDSNSPSKVFAALGNYAGIGYINGMTEYEKASARAGGSLADKAISALTVAFNTIDSLYDTDAEYSPVITPVVDLSAVRVGARNANGLFGSLMTSIGGSPTISARNANIANSTLTAQLQNKTTNSDVVSALNSLKSEILNRPQVVNNNSVNGVTYDDGSNIASAIGAIVNGIEMQTRAGVR